MQKELDIITGQEDNRTITELPEEKITKNAKRFLNNQVLTDLNIKEETRINKVKKPFLYHKKMFKKQPEEIKELKEYVLFLIKNNGHTDVLEGVMPGEFFIKGKGKRGEEKGIMLTANKLTTLNYNKQHFKGWIAHEDNATAYPIEPLHYAEMYRKTIQKIAMNYRDVNSEAKGIEAKTKMIIAIIAAVIIGGVVLMGMGKRNGWW